jgi:hypothetical protein
VINQLILLRGGAPFNYILMISRGGTSFTLSIDAFKGRSPFYYVFKLMVLRGGAPDMYYELTFRSQIAL